MDTGCSQIQIAGAPIGPGIRMKILLIKLGALGDVINTFPLVVNLKKHFNAEIDWPGCALELSPCCHPPLCG
jgi:hypothetical protein